MSTILVYIPEATLEGDDKVGDIEVKFGEVMDIQPVDNKDNCMYEAILLAANDKNLLQKAKQPTDIAQMVAAEIASNGASNEQTTKRELAKVAIRMLELPACICIENTNGTADIDYNENIADESGTIFILERVGGSHYDWLKRRGAAAGGSAGGASLALRF